MLFYLAGLYAMIVAAAHAASATNTAISGYHLGTTEIASLSIGMGVFAILTILVARDSYRRRKETEKRVAEWLKTEEQIKQRMASLYIEKEQNPAKNVQQNA
jgi:hypothetical protein